jgi:hypothetical protein
LSAFKENQAVNPELEGLKRKDDDVRDSKLGFLDSDVLIY